MKIEIIKGANGVELRRVNDDGSITIWLCETPEAALFQAAAMLYGKEPDPKRSILVGTFEKEDEKKADLAKMREELLEALKKQGMVEKDVLQPPTMVPFVQPVAPYVQPMIVPYIQPNPYVNPNTTGGGGTWIVPATTWTTGTAGGGNIAGGALGSYATTATLTVGSSGVCTNTVGYAACDSSTNGYVSMNIASATP